MSWIINGLAFVGCLTLIAIALLAWVVWRDDTPPTTTTRAQSDAWQQAIATKQAHDLAAFHSAVAMTRREQEAAAEPERSPTARTSQAARTARADRRPADSRSTLPCAGRSGRLLQKLQHVLSPPLFGLRVHFVLCGATTERHIAGGVSRRWELWLARGFTNRANRFVMGSVSAFCARTQISR